MVGRPRALRDAAGNVWVKQGRKWLLWGVNVWWNASPGVWHLLRAGSPAERAPRDAAPCEFVVLRAPGGATVAGLQVRSGRIHRLTAYNVCSGVETAVPEGCVDVPVGPEQTRRRLFGDRPYLAGPPDPPLQHRGDRWVLVYDEYPTYGVYVGAGGVAAYAFDDTSVRMDEGRGTRLDQGTYSVPVASWKTRLDQGMYSVPVASWEGATAMVATDPKLGYNQVLVLLGGGRCAYVGCRVCEFDLYDKGDPVAEFRCVWTPRLDAMPVALSRRRAYFPLQRSHVPRGSLPSGPDGYSGVRTGASGAKAIPRYRVLHEAGFCPKNDH